MATRSIASLSISFGLVAIPVRLYSATESSAAIRFKLMTAGGGRVRQQYVSSEPPAPATPVKEPLQAPPMTPLNHGPRARVQPQAAVSSKVVELPLARNAPPPLPPQEETEEPAPLERSSLVRGYEYAKGKYVLFTDEELKALEAGSRKTIDIVSFIPERAVDPIYYNKAYFLAPDKRGTKPYSLLLRAMEDTRQCALAKWAFRSKEYVVQIRVGDGGLILQQLYYADEVRAITDLDIELAQIQPAELELAKQLIQQISTDTYDPRAFVDEEKQRILAAVDQKLAGKALVAPAAGSRDNNVVDLLAALRASLRSGAETFSAAATPARTDRKPSKRAAKSARQPTASARGRLRHRSS